MRIHPTGPEENRSLLKHLSVRIVALILVFLGPGLATPEDLTIVFRVRSLGEDRVATHYYSKSRGRCDQGDEATLVDLESGRILSLSMKKKQYSETTFPEIESAMTELSAQMEKAMAGIPDDLRRKMMGDALKEVTVVKGEARTVAGVTCQNYIATLGLKSRVETCAATGLQVPFETGHFRNLPLITAPIARGNSGINKLVEAIRGIEGLALASSTMIHLLGRRIETATEATELRSGPIAPGLFEAPAGFQKVESPFAAERR